MAGAVDDGYWKNAYDWRGQLTNSVRRWPEGSLVAGEQYSYAFDDIGNRKSTLQGGNLDAGNKWTRRRGSKNDLSESKRNLCYNATD